VQFAGADGDLAALAAGAPLAYRAGRARGDRPGHHDGLVLVLPARVPGAAVIPCGQVAWRASKSTANADLSYPAPALAWAELSSSSGDTSVIPNVRRRARSARLRVTESARCSRGSRPCPPAAVDRGGHRGVAAVASVVATAVMRFGRPPRPGPVPDAGPVSGSAPACGPGASQVSVKWTLYPPQP